MAMATMDAADDDLKLFHDMRARECSKFICGPPAAASHSPPSASSSTYSLRPRPRPLSVDVDGSGFTLCALSPSTPQRRGGCSGLLPLDANKHDYDWLLTPPATPLFPCLEDKEVPPAVTNLSQRRVLTRTAPAHKTACRLLYPPWYDRGAPASISVATAFSSPSLPAAVPPPNTSTRRRAASPSSIAIVRGSPASKLPRYSSSRTPSPSCYYKSSSPSLHRSHEQRFMPPHARINLAAQNAWTSTTAVVVSAASGPSSSWRSSTISQTSKNDSNEASSSANAMNRNVACGLSAECADMNAAMSTRTPSNLRTTSRYASSSTTTCSTTTTGTATSSRKTTTCRGRTVVASSNSKECSAAGVSHHLQKRFKDHMHHQSSSSSSSTTSSHGHPQSSSSITSGHGIELLRTTTSENTPANGRPSTTTVFKSTRCGALRRSSDGGHGFAAPRSRKISSTTMSSAAKPPSPRTTTASSRPSSSSMQQRRLPSRPPMFRPMLSSAPITALLLNAPAAEQLQNPSFFADAAKLATNVNHGYGDNAVTLSMDIDASGHDQKRAKYSYQEKQQQQHEDLEKDNNGVVANSDFPTLAPLMKQLEDCGYVGKPVQRSSGHCEADGCGGGYEVKPAVLVQSSCDLQEEDKGSVSISCVSEDNVMDVEEEESGAVASLINGMQFQTSSSTPNSVTKSGAETVDKSLEPHEVEEKDMEQSHCHTYPSVSEDAGAIANSNSVGLKNQAASDPKSLVLVAAAADFRTLPATPRNVMKRSVTLEEATDIILFCNSIVHELVHDAIATRTQPSQSSYTKKEFVTLFGFPTTSLDHKAAAAPNRRKRRQQVESEAMAAAAVQDQEKRVMKKQAAMRMVQGRSSVVTMMMQESRVGNAVMEEGIGRRRGEEEEEEEKKKKKVQGRCGCSIM